jgi:hypothetical protein
MRTTKIIGLMLSALAVLYLAACQTQRPTDSAVGDPPRDYEQSAQNAIMELPLFKAHPKMAQYLRCGQPVPAYQTNSPLTGGKVVWKGYMVEINYSVTNVFGASHVGIWHVLYDGDNVHSVIGDDVEAGVHLL